MSCLLVFIASCQDCTENKKNDDERRITNDSASQRCSASYWKDSSERAGATGRLPDCGWTQGTDDVEVYRLTSTFSLIP